MYTLKTTYKKIIADTITPVNVYLKIRDKYPNSLLLESSDYHASGNSFSYVCCNPIAHIKVENEKLTREFPNGKKECIVIDKKTNVPQLIHEFSQQFKTDENEFKFINNGLFGYIAYDAVRYFEDIKISKKEHSLHIPDMHYAIYQNIIAFNHFKNEAYIFSHCYEKENNIAEIEHLLSTRNFTTYSFQTDGKRTSNLSDAQFKENVALAKKHCYRGDVFQLVLSRRFIQKFKGDEFNVYRALRSINPSPYLFYFDYGDFKIFGSSPEAQLVVKEGHTEIHPIAGTFKRTGNDEEDAAAAKRLFDDPKENAEHVMLVDLARNDLSRNGNQVHVETYKELQFFSHVIHLVSKVTAQKHLHVPTMQVVADTFPAGTLSGAPKHKAMQLIEKYERSNRDFYGGAIGFMDFQGNFNHAIMIRTFLSKNHQLHYQAGAGIVAKSSEENENQEVYNKLRALNTAIEIAETI